MSQFFETIQAKYGAGGAQFTSDHPNPGNRTEYVDKEIATLVPKPNYVTTTPEFASLQKEVSGTHAYTAREIASGAWKSQSPNQTVGGTVNQLATDGVATSVDLSASGGWNAFRGNGFSRDVPASWHAYGTQDSAMLAPAGGIARSAEGAAGSVIYGALTDRYQPQGRMATDAALDSLVSGIAHDNLGLVPAEHSDITANGFKGHSVQCENPSANNGKGERDWIVAFPQNDGSLRYFVFIAPTPDFDKMNRCSRGCCKV